MRRLRHPPANAATESVQAPIMSASGEWRNASAARQTRARTIRHSGARLEQALADAAMVRPAMKALPMPISPAGRA